MLEGNESQAAGGQRGKERGRESTGHATGGLARQAGKPYGRRLDAWIRDPSSICVCDLYLCTVVVVTNR